MRPRKRSLKATHARSISGCYHFPIFLTSNLNIPIQRMFAVVTYITLACSLCLLLYFPQRQQAKKRLSLARSQHFPQSCMITGFRRGVNEIFALLECYAVHIGSYITTFRDNLLPSSWTLKMGPTDCPETSATTYQSTLLNIRVNGKARKHQN
jgi:hypothetical protein